MMITSNRIHSISHALFFGLHIHVHIHKPITTQYIRQLATCHLAVFHLAYDRECSLAAKKSSLPLSLHHYSYYYVLSFLFLSYYDASQSTTLAARHQDMQLLPNYMLQTIHMCLACTQVFQLYSSSALVSSSSVRSRSKDHIERRGGGRILQQSRWTQQKRCCCWCPFCWAVPTYSPWFLTFCFVMAKGNTVPRTPAPS